MKNSLKKALILLLCAVVCACVLTACRSKGNLGSSSGSTGSSASSSSSGSSSGSYDDGYSSSASGFEDAGSSLSQSGADSGTESGAENDEMPSDNDSNDNSDTSSEALPTMAELPWQVTLVNGSHPLVEGYQPELATIDGSEKQFDVRAVSYLNKLLAAAESDGTPLFVVSGWRSVRYQQGLFERKVQSLQETGLDETAAEEAAAQWVARPGTSEHHLGLAVDLVSGDWYLAHDDLTEEFDTTPQFTWLCAHAAEYGFILRYPKNAEAVTGVHYEPWHYRWVGTKAAAEITQEDITLEEYLQKSR